jgi:hypothetical protein
MMVLFCGRRNILGRCYIGVKKSVLGWCKILVASASNKLLVQETQIRHNQYLCTNGRMETNVPVKKHCLTKTRQTSKGRKAKSSKQYA